MTQAPRALWPRIHPTPVGLSREIKWLRLSGLFLLLVALGLFAYFEDGPAARWLEGPTLASSIEAGIFFLVSGNVAAIGLVFLISGMSNRPIVREPRNRRAALVRLGASNLMLVCFLYVAVTDAKGFDQLMDTDNRLAVAGWLSLGLFVYCAGTSVVLFRSAWKYEVVSADEVMRSDPRPPVVYVRSFNVDEELISFSGRFARIWKSLHYTAAVSPEQELEWLLKGVGPMVAIGRPGERLPELGAARFYAHDETWKDEITALMRRASLVVIRAGNTPSLWWEVEQAMSVARRDRVVVVALGDKNRWSEFRRRFVERYGEPAPVAEPPMMPVRRLLQTLLAPGRVEDSIIYFDRDGRALERSVTFALNLRALFTNIYSPHRAMLRHALEPVMAAMGLPLKSARSQLVAVLLAFFGGVVGLHHFYMGHRRRGWWSCALFWTAIPFVLGFVDAFRIALLDDAQFKVRTDSPMLGV